MAHHRVGSIQGSGLGPPRLRAALSRHLIVVYYAASDNGRALTDKYPAAALRTYNVGDGSDVYEEMYYKIARDEQDRCQPTLLLFALRLGLERVTPVYWEALKTSLCMRQSIGIAGYVGC